LIAGQTQGDDQEQSGQAHGAVTQGEVEGEDGLRLHLRSDRHADLQRTIVGAGRRGFGAAGELLCARVAIRRLRSY
jgi:hypothetical protein